MNKPFVFKDKQKLYEAAMLRKNGWAYTSLEIVYGCDRTSLRFHFRKYVVIPIPEEVFTIEKIASRTLQEITTPIPLKTYKDYLPKGFSFQYYPHRNTV